MKRTCKELKTKFYEGNQINTFLPIKINEILDKNNHSIFPLIIFIIFSFTCLFIENQVAVGSPITDEIIIKDYSYSDGLTTNSVNCTFRDSRGYLWICSINGLYRFDGYNFQKIKANNILNSEIYCMAEDKYHNFMIGTAKKGLIYYNTHTEEIFSVPLSIPVSFNINKIFFNKNKVWLGTDKGLIVFDQAKEYDSIKKISSQLIMPVPDNPADQRNKITSIYCSEDSTHLWLGTNGGLFEINTISLSIKGIMSHPQNAIRAIVPYGKHLLVGSWDGGVFLVNPVKFSLEKDTTIDWLNQILGRKKVISISFDLPQHLWIATYGDGLFLFDLKKKTYTLFSCRKNREAKQELKSDIINHIFYDKNEQILWVSMNQPALTRIFVKKNQMQIIELENFLNNQAIEISCVTQSKIFHNNLWIGTTRNGLLLYNAENNKLIQYTSSNSSKLKLPSNEISQLYEDNRGNLWLVFRNIGLFVIPAKKLSQLSINSEKFSPINANKLFGNTNGNSYILTFYEDTKKRLWIGLWAGLFVVNFSPDFIESNNIQEVTERCNVSCVFNDDQPNTLTFPISPIQAIVEVSPNKYYAGTRDEGVIEIIESPVFKFVVKSANEINNHLSGENVRCFLKTDSNVLWIGTNAGVCAHQLSSNHYSYYNEKNGLSSENINHIASDKNGHIWLSTSCGISQIAINNQQIKNFIFEARRNEHNCLINSAYATINNNNIAFATNKSLVVFSTDSMKESIKKLPLFFTNLKINDLAITPESRIQGKKIIFSTINEAQQIRVPYNSTVYLEFAALDYIYSEQIKYKYKINAKDWITIDRNQHSISFYNQNPGEYQLELMALHPLGYNTSRTITLVFLPPWWKTGWALILYGLILLSLILSYRNLIIQRIKQKARLEQEKFERLKIEELDKLKTNFVTNLAHEIRTPLCLIINPLETLSSNAGIDPLMKDKLGTTLKNSYRLMKLANELSDFTKTEKNMLQPEIKNFDIIPIVREVFNSFSILSDSMKIDFQFHSAFEKLIIGVDREMLEKIIFNLLSNAFKYTSKNGYIFIDIESVEINGKTYAKLSVINSGEGIPPDKIEKIFDRFYQIDQARQGIGIGLSIVKSMVEIHHGIINVNSIPDENTCFEVLLPFYLAPENLISNNTDIELINSEDFLLSNSKNPANSKKYKILIIEDEEEILNFIISELSPYYKVFSATNGEEGLKIAGKIFPDIIITDILMPGINGIDLCKQLRNNIATSHIPLIIVSAKSTPEQQIEGLDAGANIYLVKPFHIQVLKNQIDGLLQLKESIYNKFLRDSDLVPADSLNNELDKEFIGKVLHFIESNLSNPELNENDLARYVCLSKVQLYRKIKSITGMSVIEFITSIRLKTAAKLVLKKNMNFSEIAYETGFSSPSYFTRRFREYYGKTPSEYVNNLEL
jgi:signal transduction histidine kinase/ligand-binding sensor domain-containing protein/CheY-like chemotaxis protein/AraC-like DNA-binding protein